MQDLLNNCFITTGTNQIQKELLFSVQRPENNYDFKPSGGLWASKYYGECGNVCDWLNLLQANPERRVDVDFSNATLLLLKEDAKICFIQSEEDVKRLSTIYHSLHHEINFYDFEILKNKYAINYESLSEDYDGFYVDLSCLPERMIANTDRTNNCGEFGTWGCNTLLLFNVDCIKSYSPITIKKVEQEDGYQFYARETNQYREIPCVNNEYAKLVLEAEALFLDMIISEHVYDANSYSNYLYKLRQLSNNLWQILNSQHEDTVRMLNELLNSDFFFPVEKVISQNVMTKTMVNDDKKFLKKFVK